MKPFDYAPLTLYCTEIARNAVMSRAEEQATARLVQAGDPAAREKMIERNLRLVVKIAGDFANRGLPLEDLVAEGNLGLMEAVDRYDPDNGAKFSTYAAWWIKQAMRSAVQSHSRTIRLPAHIHSRAYHIQQAVTTLEERFGRTPSDRELAEEVELTEDQVRQVLDVCQPITHLETSLGEDSSADMGDVIADEDARDPEVEATVQDDVRRIRELMAGLPERERYILETRFGLTAEDEHSQTLGEVGDHLGVSRERIRQLQEKAITSLRFAYANDDLLAVPA